MPRGAVPRDRATAVGLPRRSGSRRGKTTARRGTGGRGGGWVIRSPVKNRVDRWLIRTPVANRGRRRTDALAAVLPAMPIATRTVASPQPHRRRAIEGDPRPL